MTSTTTIAAIRDNLATRIGAIAPTVAADTKFRVFREEQPFREWAAANPAAAFRRFSVRAGAVVGQPEIIDSTATWIEQDIDVVVAYPTNGRFGSRVMVDVDEIVFADLAKIDHTVGTEGYATFAASIPDAAVTTIEAMREEAGPVTYGVLRLRAHFYRSNA